MTYWTLTQWTMWAIRLPLRAAGALLIGLMVGFSATVGACRTVWAETE